MLSFMQYLNLTESLQDFEHNPSIGWWKDKKHITVYHGTHENNYDTIKKHGINRADPDTGMISVTLDPHTAHGYAAMSGEHNFRKTGQSAHTTPHDKRITVQMKLPMDWLTKNMDHNYGGNVGIAQDKLKNKALYQKHTGNDHEYYQMTEFRLRQAIPAKFITGIMKKHGN